MTALRGWFDGLAPRERLGVLVVAALAAVLLLTVLVLRPLAAFKAGAKDRHADAAETAALVDRAVAGASGQGTGAPTGAPLRAVISDTADAAGIVIDRYDISEDSVDLTIGSADAARLYAWLGGLSSDHGLSVAQGTVRGVEGGLVSARLTLERSS